MVAWYSSTVKYVYQNYNLVCMYYPLYEHVHVEFYVTYVIGFSTFIRSQVKACILLTDTTCILKHTSGQLTVERALSVDILRPLFDSICIGLIHNVFSKRRMRIR